VTRPPVLSLVVALVVLCGGAVPAAAQSVAPAARPRPPAVDSLAADSLAPRRPVVQRRATPTEAAMGRLRAAVARGVARRGPFPALDARFAGVSWIVPPRRSAAIDELVAMRRAGVRAVRTGLVGDTLLLGAASTLGIALYQDLPVQGLPAAHLLRRSDASARLLDAALDRGRPYPAARHYGLAVASDTSDPRARPYFERLTEIAHAAGAETYYTTRFPRSDLADGTVDLVLLDVPHGETGPAGDPVALLAQWRARSQTPVGLASVGAVAVPGREGGWRTPGSAAAQARRLEDVLSALISLADPPAATFVGLWRDAPAGARRDVRAEVTGARAGLHDEAGAPRPALAVAAGFFTGAQRVFAFDAGPDARRAPRETSALLVVGWTLVLGLGLFMVGAPRLSTLVPRYFGRHDLYREAVARGYDLAAGQMAGLALGLSVAVGVALAAVLRALGQTDALAAATASWSPAAQSRLVGLLGHPLALVAMVALGYGAYLLLNLIWLHALVGRRRLRAGQALSLAVWSRWAWLPIMALALLLSGVGPQTATALAPALLGLGLLAEAVAGYRMLLDFSAVTRVPPARALGLGFGVPFLVAVAVAIWLATAARPEAAFVWHLATRG
jgi:hypothetical protein